MTQKEIEEYRQIIFRLDEMSKCIKVKTRKTKKFKRKNELASTDMISIKEEKFLKKFQQKVSVSEHMNNEKNI